MGVRGLTTFIEHRSFKCFRPYELHDTYLVVDGFSICCQLYIHYTNRNDCFGGDYDAFAHSVEDFLQCLSRANVTPLVVFDGGYERRKLRTVVARLSSKLQTIQQINIANKNEVIFPMFLSYVFIQCALKLGVKLIRCEFEADAEIAHLARSLNCPVLSYDSDFFIYDCLYIPCNTLDLKRQRNSSHLSCKIYRVDIFLALFGLTKGHLPILGVVLGNDYIKRAVFRPFYRHIHVGRSTKSTQLIIASVLEWLRHETPETAVTKILSRYKLNQRRKIAWHIENALMLYNCEDSKILKHFSFTNILPKVAKLFALPNVDEIIELPDEANEVVSSDESEENEAVEVEEEEKDDPMSPLTGFPDYFIQDYNNCLHPAGFINMIYLNHHYCLPLIETTEFAHSHTISLDIIGAIHKILRNPSTKQVICYALNENGDFKSTLLPRPIINLPSVKQIGEMDEEARKKLLLEILSINCNILNQFPANWHLFLIGLIYWKKHSITKTNSSMFYSLILCAIVLNYIDDKIGFYRNINKFMQQFGRYDKRAKKQPNAKTIVGLLDEIDREEAAFAQYKLIHYFRMDAKMQTNHKLYDIRMVHTFSELQSFLYNLNCLNGLLRCPFQQFEIAKFFNGTFLFNMSVNLNKRTDLSAYLNVLLENSQIVLGSLLTIFATIEKDAGTFGNATTKKKKKKNKKVEFLNAEVMEDMVEDCDTEYIFDPNNMYSLLSVK